MKRQLEIVLRAFIPALFRILDCAPYLHETYILPVVLKAQRYRIHQNRGYAGKWHIEGLSEDIRAVAVYYNQVDPELTGGNMKFRPSRVPGTNLSFLYILGRWC